jgi:hypothetical protein
MATRGRVGIVRDDGTVASIYQHWDSYPSRLGATLLNHYKNKEKIEKLIALGNCSFISEEVDIPEGVFHSFDKPLDNVTIAYGRDRGAEGTEPHIDGSKEEFWKSDIEEYGYLFKDGKWYVATSHGYEDENGNYVSVEPNERKVVELTAEVCEQEDDLLH